MKSVLFDPNCYKFSMDIVDLLSAKGEEKHTLYYDSELVKWADTVWFETCDNNLHQATQVEDPSILLDKKVICRIIDIEAWCGLHKQVDWHYVTDVIFTSHHIKKLVENDLDFVTTKVHHIPYGVNLDKFSFRRNPSRNYNIAWVAERWYAKGIDYFLQYAAMLYKVNPLYKITCVGIWADNATGGWYRAYIDQFMQKNPMNVEFIERVEDMNEFLEGMGYAICFSKKETFSYAIAEGMAKGLKPIIHNFYGAEDIWDKKYIWNTIDEAIKMTTNDDYNPSEYRRYIEEHYSLSNMLRRIDELLC